MLTQPNARRREHRDADCGAIRVEGWLTEGLSKGLFDCAIIFHHRIEGSTLARYLSSLAIIAARDGIGVFKDDMCIMVKCAWTSAPKQLPRPHQTTYSIQICSYS